MKKIVSFVLLCGACLFSLPVLALTYTDNDGVTWMYETYSYYEGGSYKTGLQLTGMQGNSGTVVVPDSLPYNSGKAAVVSIANNTSLFNQNKIITNVTLPNKIKNIPNYAFGTASNLVSINIPSSVTSIGLYAFNGCTSLSSIVIPESVTSLEANGFKNCTSLKSAEVKAKVTNLSESLFAGCSKLSQVKLPATLQSMGNSAFKSCSALKEITLPESLTSIGEQAFYQSGLESIDLANVKSIGNYAFYECSSLQQVTLPKVEAIGNYVFQNCSKLTNITIPTTTSSIGNYAFSNCTALANVTIPSSVITMGMRAFEYCSALKTISVPVTFMGESAFEKCTGLQSVEIGSNLKTIGTNAFLNCSNLTSFTTASDNANFAAKEGVLFNKNYTQLVLFPTGVSGTYTIPNTVTEVGANAFGNCSQLTAITIPTSVTTIGSYAFQNCKGVEELQVPSTVTDLGSAAFEGCNLVRFMSATPATLQSTSLISANAFIVVPSSALTTYREAEKWSNFASQIVPDNTYKKEVSIAAESSASALHKAIGEANLENVISLKVSGSFNSYDMMIIRNKMTRLRNLDLSDASITANKYEYYQGHYSHKDSLIGQSFAGMKLSSVKLPRTLKYMEGAFQKCTNLSSITTYGNLTTIGFNTFNNCTALSNVTLADGLNNIGEKAFYYCSSLHSITFPKSLQTIGNSAFQRSGLNDIYLPANLNFIGEYAFSGDPYSNSTVYFSQGISSRYVYTSTYTSAQLTSVTFDRNCKLKTISNYAFAFNSNLKQVSFADDSLKSIQYGAFACCGLESVELPSCVSHVGAGAFNNCSKLKYAALSNQTDTIMGGLFYQCSSLQKVDFKEGNKIILPKAFQYCTKLTTVNLPSSVRKIQDNAFMNCTNLDTIRISSSVESIGTQAFNSCSNVRAIYTYTVEPTTIDQQTFSCWSTANLFVPKTSYYNYYYDTQWSQFLKLIEFNENYKYFYINNDYELGCDVGTIAGHPIAQVNQGGGLLIGCDTESTQDLSKIILNRSDKGGASVIANCNLTADTMQIHLTLNPYQWYFFCFPYDINRSLVSLSIGQGVWYTYDGNIRAMNGSGGWQKLADSEKVLRKGKGYIFQCNKSAYLDLRIVNPSFGCEDVGTVLEAFGAENAGDASWNFVGNPFPSYFDINALFDAGFNAPITIWNRTNKTYQTVRPGDDTDHTFTPFEGFFVQKPTTTSVMKFLLSGRESKIQSQARIEEQAPKRKTATTDRQLINLELSDGNTADKTRIVFNPSATIDYEIGSDASKFLSLEAVPQLYTIENGSELFSINERPATELAIALGFVAPTDGQYTLRATRMDAKIMLYDNELNQEVDLSQDDYTFTALAGTDNTRFAIRKITDVSTELDIAKLAANGPVDVYSLNGILLIHDAQPDAIDLPEGVYIFKSNNMVEKFVVQ